MPQTTSVLNDQRPDWAQLSEEAGTLVWNDDEACWEFITP
jgi:hypothetical protein